MVPRAAALLAALAFPAVVSAAAQWTAPERLSSPHLFISEPGVAFTPGGTAVATWGWQDGAHIDSATTGSRVAYRPPGAAWTAEQPIRGDVAGPPVTYAGQRWAVPTQTLTAGDTTTVGVVFGHAGGVPEAPRTIFTGRTLARVQLVSNADGRMALAWQQRAGGKGRAYMATRQPGKAFGTPFVVADGRVRNVSVAVGPRGDLLVAYEDRGTVKVRIRGESSKKFGRPVTIKAQEAFTQDLRSELTGSGRAYVAWTAQFGSEGGERGPIHIQAAVKPSGQGWREAQLLDSLAADRAIRGFALDVPDDGGRNATVAWVGYESGRYVVRTSATGFADGRFGAARDLPGGTGEFEVDDLDDGTLMLTRFFGADADTGSQVMASRDLGPPEAVSAEQEARSAGVARDGSRGFTAVWSNRPAGSRHPLSQIETVVESAQRP